MQMFKNSLYSTCLFFLTYSIWMWGVSDDELNTSIEAYKIALQQLCDDYGLSDAKIEVESKLSNHTFYEGRSYLCSGLSYL